MRPIALGDGNGGQDAHGKCGSSGWLGPYFFAAMDEVISRCRTAVAPVRAERSSVSATSSNFMDLLALARLAPYQHMPLVEFRLSFAYATDEAFDNFEQQL